MKYEIETIDYIFDVYDYAIFMLPKYHSEIPMDAWDAELIPFSNKPSEFAVWLTSNWKVTISEFGDERTSPSPVYNWSVQIDFYRGIRGKEKNIEIEGFYPNDRRGIYFTSQSLFLFEFLAKFTSHFKIDKPICISVGTDLHIVEFTGSMDLIDFLKEIHSHKTRFDIDEAD
jgi:hypothetical protein